MLSKHFAGKKHVISGDYVAHLRNFAMEQNVSMDVLLKDVGLSPQQLLNPPLFVDDADFNTLGFNLFEALEFPFLKAAELAKTMTFSLHGALGVTIQGAKNLEQMLLLAQKYYRSRASNRALVLEKRDGFLHVIPQSDYLERSPYITLAVMVSFTILIGQKLKRHNVNDRCRIRLKSKKPSYVPQQWQEALSVSFNEVQDELLVPLAWSNLPIDSIDNSFITLAETQCLETLASLTSNDVKTIVTDLLKHSPTNMLNIKAVANELCMSPSSLQRRLKDEGLTFKALKHHIIVEEAKRLLLEGATVEEIAEILGFNDASSFSKSFKSIVGATPGEFRRAV